MMRISKDQRRQLILEIISAKPIQTQQELTRQLEKAGARVTQATISRDVREMGLIKEPIPGGGRRYRAPGKEPGPGRHIFGDLVTDVEYSENLVVVKTVPAGAQSTALVIDSLANPKILASLAGDDTVLVVVRQREQAPQVAAELKRLVKE
jgi:transcriptional regulator of arginine metabolism